MKHRLLSILIFLSFSIVSNAQWESVGAGIDSGQLDYFSISVVDKNIVWALPNSDNFTQSLEYTKTTDGGETWQEGSLPDSIEDYYPENIYALDKNTAWIVIVKIPEQSHSRIFKTENGGDSWIEQVGEFNEDGRAFGALHFFDNNVGVAFGSTGPASTTIDTIQIFRTEDGGNNWNRLSPNNLPTPIQDERVFVYSGNSSYEVKGDTIWFVTSKDRTYRSTDKGVTWEAFDVGLSAGFNFTGLSSIAFANSQNGLVVTFQPNSAARTDDGGETWTQFGMPSSPSLGAIEYIPGTGNAYLINDGFLDSKRVLLTRNGGINWEPIIYPFSLNCMQFISPTIGFGGGTINPIDDSGIYKWVGDFSDTTATNTKEFLLNSELVDLYPNPSYKSITLDFEEVDFGTDDLVVEISSIEGQVFSKNSHSCNGKLTIPVSDLPVGIYTIRITGKEIHILKKFSKI